MKSLKSKVRKILKSKLDLEFKIKSIGLDQQTMNKKIFIEVIEQLKKIEDRRDFLSEEIGLDMTAYEDQFFSVIENLFKLVFNKSQLGLIQMYLYNLLPDKNWDGMITIEEGKEEKTVPFKSANDVWEVIKKYSND
jgi:cation transport regulator ChaB|tara:strand:- start:947 stop:1354 length:408 start_codon:yes stop_codon:yes gene_type:complete